MAKTAKKGNDDRPEGPRLTISEKEADRWSVEDDFGIDPRVIAARKKKPQL